MALRNEERLSTLACEPHNTPMRPYQKLAAAVLSRAVLDAAAAVPPMATPHAKRTIREQAADALSFLGTLPEGARGRALAEVERLKVSQSRYRKPGRKAKA